MRYHSHSSTQGQPIPSRPLGAMNWIRYHCPKNPSRQRIVQVCACRSGSRVWCMECLMSAKRALSATLALLLAVSFAAPSGARALAQYGFTYTQSGGEATVTGCDGACPTTLNIPAVLGGYYVTTIGASAFASEDLTTVTIPSTVTTIGDSAFASNEITTVTIPNSVASIGDYAFTGNDLSTVTIPNSVTTIGVSAFEINLLTSVTIGNSVISIGNLAFYANTLTSVTIPDSVTSIGDYAFYGNSLTSVTIPNSVTSIGTEAFSYNALTSATFLGNAPEYGALVFRNNESSFAVYRSLGATGWGIIWSGSSVSIIDQRATATVKPTAFGTATVGRTLTARGTWVGYPTPTLRYQWYVCTRAVTAARSTVPSTCKRITGATRSTYKLTSAQRGKYVAVLVTGTSLRTTATTWLSKTTAKIR